MIEQKKHIKNVAMVVKMTNPQAITLCASLFEIVSGRGVEAYGSKELAAQVPGLKVLSPEKIRDVVDAVIVLGGDGTMLYASRLLLGKKIPILGVNMGGLGFLTSVKIEEIFDSIEKLLVGLYETEERMMLDVRIVRGIKIIAEQTILNDVVIKCKLARLIKLDVSIAGDFVTTYRADGLVVATPTGSTAYALSASGPILYPTIHSIIVVPICPFNLTHKPVVIPDWMDVEVTVRPDNPEAFVTLDGQLDIPLEGKDVVKMKRSEACVYIVKPTGKGYFSILRERLMWEVKK